MIGPLFLNRQLFINKPPISKMSLAVDPLSLVEEDLSQYSVELAVQTIKRLPLIAKALGPAQTRERLLTFIVKYAGFDDLSVAIGGDSANLDRVISDEVLAELAKALGEFLPLVGGVAFARELLDILFYFSTTQETCVREAAVASFRNLIPLMAQQDVFFYFYHRIDLKYFVSSLNLHLCTWSLLSKSSRMMNGSLQSARILELFLFFINILQTKRRRRFFGQYS
jgi:hypothetical protein